MLHVGAHVEEGVGGDGFEERLGEFSTESWSHLSHGEGDEGDKGMAFVEIEGPRNEWL